MKHKTSLIVVLSVIAVSILCLLIFPFGNPQWAKFIYMFQYNVFPNKLPEPPRGYSGSWTYWTHDGNKWVELGYKNGSPDGEYKEWNEVGKIIANGIYKDGKSWNGTFNIWMLKG